MASLSDQIEQFLKQMIEAASGRLEIQRQVLAARFGCAPSQINYVLETRFTVQRGYTVESRRGGSGYLRIIRYNLNGPARIVEFIEECLGVELPQREAEGIIERLAEEGSLSPREAALMKAVVDRETLSVDPPYRDRLRAALLKRMLVAIVSCQEE
ncbi:MAG TPA: CtsR family transcriptional regulator [Bacillota bacterium]|jgi:transcriptional regulator CtsR